MKDKSLDQYQQLQAQQFRQLAATEYQHRLEESYGDYPAIPFTDDGDNLNLEEEQEEKFGLWDYLIFGLVIVCAALFGELCYILIRRIW